ncbi:unnamed protein product, partial [Heterosigma akashiwo]
SSTQWAILVPVISRGDTVDQCRYKLKTLMSSIMNTTSGADRNNMILYFGVHYRDKVYNDPHFERTLRREIKELGFGGAHFIKFSPGYRGRVCWIWNDLTVKAFSDGNDFVVLLGDDVQLMTKGWKQVVEQKFRNISDQMSLPFGLACVAFRDQAFPCFPTFPVVHKLHVDIFGCLFPKEFINQHGDPYLFEIYRRWGAAAFADASLINTVGGAEKARYQKQDTGVIWRDALLTQAIDTVERWLQSNFRAPVKRFHCLDVVCPTYRCDRMQNPPWGVTANICVEARTQNRVWFNGVYPRTGGGEDVDFCLNIKNKCVRHADRTSAIVAVPGAVVHHPFWRNPLKQVAGWASGDILCLQELPHSTFYTLPNWIETCLGLVCYRLWSMVTTAQNMEDCLLHSAWLVQQVGLVLTLEIVLLVPCCRVGDGARKLVGWKKLAVTFLSVLPSIIQDAVRLKVKLVRGYFYQIGLCFDWMDGQSNHVGIMQFTQLYKTILRVGIIMLMQNATNLHVAHLFMARPLSFPFAPVMPAKSKELIIHQSPSFAKPFVVLSHQRCGTNLLCGILHNHNEVIMHNELFHDQTVGTFHPHRIEKLPGNFDLKRRDENPLQFLSFMFDPNTVKSCMTSRNQVGVRATGFKMFPEHWKPTTPDFVVDPRVKKVILERRNKLAVYVSMMRAAKTGWYMNKSLDDLIVKIDPAKLQQFVLLYQSWYQYYSHILNGQ